MSDATTAHTGLAGPIARVRSKWGWFVALGVLSILAGMFALAAAGLVFELAVNPQTRKSRQATPRLGLIADYAVVLSNPFARIVIVAAFLEGALAWGAFAYIGADLHLRFGLTYTLVGITVGCFGIGASSVSSWKPSPNMNPVPRRVVAFTSFGLRYAATRSG